jgi:putative ABC transport system permease protein
MRMEKRIPFALKFLRWFCPSHLLEEIEGDLLQKFERDVKKFAQASDTPEVPDTYRRALRKARRRLLWNTLRFFRPGILRRKHSSVDLNVFPMFSNYIKVALRFMLRDISFTSINMSGLALGITGALMLFLWIGQEMSFEQFHQDKERLYVAWNRDVENGQLVCWETTPRVLAPTLKEEYAAVESTTSYAHWGVNHLFIAGDKRIMKTTGVFVDPAFLTMLAFPLMRGDAARVFENPKSIVVTEKFARQLFGNKEALGESVTITQSGSRFNFIITGILKDLPPNTQFKFEYLISFGFLESLGEIDTNWGNNSVTTLVKLKPGHDIAFVNESIKGIEKKHYANGKHIEIFLYPLTKMRLYSRFENGVPAGGRIEVIRMLGILGVGLLAIACSNFINLSTARAQRRSKEVAVRKVTGAVRYALVTQFLFEAILMAVGAGALSLIIAYLLLPFFNATIGQELSMDFGSVYFWLTATGLVLLVGVLAGSYPALYLSAFRPVPILKGAGISSHRSLLRTLLVVFQFGFAGTLIVSAIAVRKQIIYVQHRDAGYSTGNLLYIPLTGDLPKNFNALRSELIQTGASVSVTKVSAPITEQWSSTGGIQWRGKNPEDRTDFERIYMDDNASTTFGLTFLQGRDFDLEHFATDSTAVVVNETALRVMGFENPIGEIIKDNDREWHVVGVVKDFVFTSPFQKVEPIVLFGAMSKWAFNVVYIKLSPSQPLRQNLKTLASIISKYNPEYPFEYHFADLDYKQKFDNMQTTFLITKIFTSVAIFISCLGLLGLATHMAEARIKEIGIRKVLGGTVLSITRLLGYSTLKPILIAMILFMPVAWVAINRWLQTFAYRISLDIWTFALSAFCVLAIALLTIGIQTIRAATSNPTESLRSE